MPVPDREKLPLTDSAEFAGLRDRFASCEVLAVDTEFNRTSTYRPQLCLLQLAGAGDDALIDMLVDADLSPLKHLLAEGDSLKIFHAGKQDLEALQLNQGWLPNRIFDTQIGAGLLGHPPQAGYAKLVESVLGLQLDKAATRTDWSKRPLSVEQLREDRRRAIRAIWADLPSEEVSRFARFAGQLGDRFERFADQPTRKDP